MKKGNKMNIIDNYGKYILITIFIILMCVFISTSVADSNNCKEVCKENNNIYRTHNNGCECYDGFGNIKYYPYNNKTEVSGII